MKKNRRKIGQKRWKMDEKMVSAVSGRSGSFWVAPRSRGNALGTASGRQVGPSWPPSWPSWPPCWLAVLDAKLAAPGDPNSARSRPRPRFERVHQLERRSHRFFVVFVLSRESSNVPRVPVFTVFCWVRTKFAPNMQERRQTSKIKPFCPAKSSSGASANP